MFGEIFFCFPYQFSDCKTAVRAEVLVCTQNKQSTVMSMPMFLHSALLFWLNFLLQSASSYRCGQRQCYVFFPFHLVNQSISQTHVHTNLAVSSDTVASMHKLYFSFKPKNTAGNHCISLNMLFDTKVTQLLVC